MISTVFEVSDVGRGNLAISKLLALKKLWIFLQSTYYWMSRSTFLGGGDGGIFCPLQLGNFLAIFRSFALQVIFCALRFSNFWQFLEVFFLLVIICALQFRGVSCVLEEFPVFWIVG